MENLNLHKQKLYALIVCAVALIAMILPWQTYPLGIQFGGMNFGGGGTGSINGFHGWGWISLLGILAIIIASLMGDKTKTYDANSKMIALGGFAGVALGAIIFMIRVLSAKGTSLGFGLFICIAAGVAGAAWVAGLIKMPENKTTAPPPPPAPPKS